MPTIPDRNVPIIPTGFVRVTGTEMIRLIGAAFGAFVLSAGLIAETIQAAKPSQAQSPSRARKPAMAVAHEAETMPVESQAALVKQYCVGCHNDKGKAGQLSLASFDPGQADQTAETTE